MWKYEPFGAAPPAQHLLQPEEEQQEPHPGSEERQHHLEDTEGILLVRELTGEHDDLILGCHR